MLNLKVQAFGLGNFLFRFARNLVLPRICVKSVLRGIFLSLKIQPCSVLGVDRWRCGGQCSSADQVVCWGGVGAATPRCLLSVVTMT